MFLVIVGIIGFMATMQCLSIFEKHAQRMGLPDTAQSSPAAVSAALVLLLSGLLLHAAVHECGHALAAWSVGFRVKAIRRPCNRAPRHPRLTSRL